MDGLRNPFAIRGGRVILIEDLDYSQRGLKCQCKCPSCNGDFIAKMGDVKVHHFAHSKDACDEVLAYTSGLYKLIHQILSNGSPFYVPALIIIYSVPYEFAVAEDDLPNYYRIVHESYSGKNAILISKGVSISFDHAELNYNKKNHIEALELSYNGRKMAIKVQPPDTVCKISAVTKHKDMATLLIDFADAAESIQNSDSRAFSEFLFSKRLYKRWIFNPAVKRVYPFLLDEAEKAHAAYMARKRSYEEEKKKATMKPKEDTKSIILQQIERSASRRADTNSTNCSKRLSEQKRTALGYEQVKDIFNQQTEQIRDSFDIRWIKCELCGEIKKESEFMSYGGAGSINLGQCKTCSRRANGRSI